MIQANELRIGNYVKGKIGGDIWKLTANMILHIDSGNAIVEGIKLTPEILEKIDWDGYIKLSINSNFKIDKEGRLYYCGDYAGININYLHQLQNLYFALTGKELVINM